MGTKIGFIAPYAELADIASEVRSQLGLDFPVVVGLLEGAICPAEELAQQGAEVLISRGGTAALLRNNLEVPIVEIKVTGYDVMAHTVKGKGVPYMEIDNSWHKRVPTEGEWREAMEILGGIAE